MSFILCVVSRSLAMPSSASLQAAILLPLSGLHSAPMAIFFSQFLWPEVIAHAE